MPSGFHTWSQTAGTNASADSAINFSEGQAPSSLNDSDRAKMAVLAKWRDDNNGSLTTAGTSTAYTLATNTVFTTLALLDKQTLKFTVNATSGAAPTLNVDGLGAKSLRNATGATPATGAYVSGSVYTVTYFNSNAEFLVHDQQPIILAANSVVTANITDANVTLAKIVNTAASRLLGNPTGSAAAPSEISLGAGLSFSGTSIVAAAVAAPLSGAVGLVIANNTGTPTSIIDITADQATMLTSSGVPIFAASVSVSVNTSSTGANGIDTGARGNSTWYNLFLISNGSVTAGLASLSATAPTMPGGYTYAVRVGAMITDIAGNFMRTRQTGNQTQWSPQSSGNTTVFPSILNASSAITLWTASSLATFAPPTATAISVSVYSDMQSGGLFNMAANGNGASSTGALFHNNGTSLAGQIPMTVRLESQNLYFGVSGAVNSYRVKALGWTDKVNAN